MIPTLNSISCVVLKFICLSYVSYYLMQQPLTVQPTEAMVAVILNANAAQHFVSPLHVGFADADTPAIKGE